MIVNELYVCTKWVKKDGENWPDLHDDNAPAGSAWVDVTQQPAENIPTHPNVYIVQAWVSDAIATQIGNSNRFIVLARRRYDTEDPDTLLFDKFDEQPSAPQLVTLKDMIMARFPNVDEDKWTLAGQAILRSGRTRIEIIELLVERWRQFLKAIS